MRRAQQASPMYTRNTPRTTAIVGCCVFYISISTCIMSSPQDRYIDKREREHTQCAHIFLGKQLNGSITTSVGVGQLVSTGTRSAIARKARGVHWILTTRSPIYANEVLQIFVCSHPAYGYHATPMGTETNG